MFCNHHRKKLKALYWDRNGFFLWKKRFEKFRFLWPQTGHTARELSFEQLIMLLDGIDFWHAHERLELSAMK
jgi:transposase